MSVKVSTKSKLTLGADSDERDENGMKIPTWKLWYVKFMAPFAVLSHAWLAIQAISIFIDKDAKGVSLVAYIVYIISSVIWFVYGMFVLTKKNIVIVLSAVTAIALGVLVIVGVLMYPGSNEPSVICPEPNL